MPRPREAHAFIFGAGTFGALETAELPGCSSAWSETDGLEWWRRRMHSKPDNAKVRGPEAALSPEAPSRLPGSTPGTNEERAGNA